jgi:hypothetical protein
MLKILTETKEGIEEKYKLMMGKKSESQNGTTNSILLSNNYFKTLVIVLEILISLWKIFIF